MQGEIRLRKKNHSKGILFIDVLCTENFGHLVFCNISATLAPREKKN
jgi:hypothetical protein